MLRKNFSGRMNDKRKDAVTRLESRLKLSDEELVKDAKRFRETPGASEADMNTYRASMRKIIENTKKKING